MTWNSESGSRRDQYFKTPISQYTQAISKTPQALVRVTPGSVLLNIGYCGLHHYLNTAVRRTLWSDVTAV
jgi:hypothetical protein